MQSGQRVFLKFDPELWGTVSATRADGSFRVTWFTEGRKPGQARQRHWYTREALVTGITVGTPEA